MCLTPPSESRCTVNTILNLNTSVNACNHFPPNPAALKFERLLLRAATVGCVSRLTLSSTVCFDFCWLAACCLVVHQFRHRSRLTELAQLKETGRAVMAEKKEWAGGEVLFAGGTDWAMVRCCCSSLK